MCTIPMQASTGGKKSEVKSGVVGGRGEGGGDGGVLVCAELTLAPIPSPVHPTHRGVTVLDSDSNGVVMRPLIQEFHAVALSSDGRGKVDGDHLKEGMPWSRRWSARAPTRPR